MPAEAPIDLTRSLRDISVTERNAFKQCRRRWWLETIENLEPRGLQNWAFAFGTGIHAGLEAYYKNIDEDPLAAALLDFDKWCEETDLEIRQANLGPIESGIRNELLEFKELGQQMLTNYSQFALLQDDFIVCAVEGEWTEQGKKLLEEHSLTPPYKPELHPILHESGRFLVPIIDTNSLDFLVQDPVLSSRLDLIVYRNTPGLRGFWIKDHKTSGSSPSDRGVDMDDQVTGYCYTFWRHTGIIPRGVIFNYLIKQLPKEPRILQGGKLSTAKDQLTTAPLYRKALLECGLLTKDGKVTSTAHAECYSSLLAYGWSRFFKRFEVQRNEHELTMFEKRLISEYNDMLHVYDCPEERAYPHLSQYVCPGCPVMPICQAMEDGSDFQDVIDNRYQQAKDRKA